MLKFGQLCPVAKRQDRSRVDAAHFMARFTLGMTVLGKLSLSRSVPPLRARESDRAFAQFTASVNRLDLKAASAITDGSVNRVPSHTSLNCEREVGIETAVHAFEINIRIYIHRQFQMDTAIDSFEFQVA